MDNKIEKNWAVKNYNIWDNLFMGDGAYRKYFNAVLILTGLIFGIVITDFSIWSEVVFFVTAYCLGVPCVITLADRAGNLGNWLGIASNIGEMFVFGVFKTWGMVMSGFYFGIMHLVGLVRWNDEKYQAEDGKVKISKMDKEQLVFTVIFFFVGLGILVVFGPYLGFSLDVMGPWLYWGNILTFAISITSQFLMIMGKSVAWLGWASSNFVNFGLNLATGNYWFMIRDVIYQLNAIAGFYQWRKLDNE